jgi:putative ABC transport system substrate-binding protein
MNIIKKTVFILLLILFQMLLLSACTGKKQGTYRVGIVNVVPKFDSCIVGFIEEMKRLGYSEGKNIHYHYNGATTNMSRLPDVVETLLEAKPDLVLSITTPATLTVKKAAAGTGIPLLFSIVTDPLGAGIVKNMRHPGDNITGIAFGIQEARRLEWLLRIAPKTRRIYVPYNPRDKSPLLALKTMRTAAAKLGVTLLTRKVTDKKTLNHAISNIPADADALFLLPDSLIAPRIPDLAAAANRRKLPISVATISAIEESNVLTSFGFDRKMIGKQAARLADQIFKGASPGDLPVEMAEFYLGINLKVAKKIGLKIPDEILRQAHIIVR